jgi:serine/threonine protein kinase
MEEYLAAVQARRPPQRQAFLAEHADIAAALAECLDGLEFIRGAAPHLQESPADCGALALAAFQGLHPQAMLGDFRIVREVGRGGMGVVYEAVQVSLGRRVALKVLPAAAALDARQLQRFKNEAQAAAGLHHGNIVPVFGVGCEGGVHYYAMQFIDGKTLARIIGDLRQQSGLGPAEPPTSTAAEGDAAAGPGDSQPTTDSPSPARKVPAATAARTDTVASPPAGTTNGICWGRAYCRRVAELGVAAAEALEHAHGLGVIHRDVKPANLMLDGHGHLWVTDFGLAHVQRQSGLTMTGDLVGTLRYMSPEQALGQRGLVDHRTDVYALGVTLYELLTLEPAFPGSDRQNLLRRIAEEEPRPPRRLNRAVPPELETVVLKAMAKAPAERYGTAQELADDLRRYLEDKPIRARRPTVFQRLKKWLRRHQGVAAMAVIGLVVVLVVAVALLAFNNVQIDKERKETDTQRAAAVENLLQAKQNLLKAHQAVNDYFTSVSDSPELDQPGLQILRKKLLEAALQHYEDFLKQQSDDPGLQAEMAATYFRLGQIYHQIDRNEDALAALKKGLATARRFRRDYPDLKELQKKWAGFWKGDDALTSGMAMPRDLRAAFHSLQQALLLWEDLVHDHPQERTFKSDLAGLYWYTGQLLENTPGQRAQAIAQYRKGCDTFRGLLLEDPAVRPYRAGLAECAFELAQLLEAAGGHQEAVAAFDEALALREKLVAEFPAVPLYQIALVRSLAARCARLARTDTPEAEKAVRRAIQISQALAEEFPTVPLYQQRLSGGYRQLIDLLHAGGRHPQAEQAAAEARQVLVEVSRKAAQSYEKWLARHPKEPAYLRGAAESYRQLAQCLKSDGQLVEAEKASCRALTLQGQLADAAPSPITGPANSTRESGKTKSP